MKMLEREVSKASSLLRRRAPWPHQQIPPTPGALLPSKASSPARSRLVWRSELITDSHFFFFSTSDGIIALLRSNTFMAVILNRAVLKLVKVTLQITKQSPS